MLENRGAVPAIVAGVASLASSAAAVALDASGLVMLAAALALVSVVLVLSTRPAHGPGTDRDDPTPTADDTAAGRGDAASPPATALGPSSPAAESSGDATDGPGGAPEDEVPAGVVDPATGLFNQLFFDASLVKRVSAARRSLRPLSVAVADVASGLQTPGAEPVPGPAPEIGRIMLDVFREADLLARADDGRYLILLEDTPENGTVWTLERFRRRLTEELPGHTLWVGVSCYPAYGFGAQQLVAQARRALDGAREWKQDRIEVTAESPDD
jgi:GGDEF domain-containing protein